MMLWFREIRAILAGEPESWLTYLYGQQLHNRPLFTRAKPRHTGFILQVAKFLLVLLRLFRLKQQPELKCSAKFFVFADTANQINSLKQTLYSLGELGEKPTVVVNQALLDRANNAKGYILFQLTLMDTLRALFLFANRGVGLYRMVKRIHPVSVDWHFAKFCGVYMYLVYFYRTLSQTKPQFVITANDHNVPNRCMLAVAHYLGIKTVYMQHASVSNIFPALRVNYAFLDGQCALDTYRMCEPNQPCTIRDAPLPKVILSGQKKHLKRGGNNQTNVIGVALNALDDSKAGIKFINALATSGLDIRLRWHPGQSSRDTIKYLTAFSGSVHVTLSDPRQESISEFMEKVGWLIAGNSSVHLEAALAGVMPIYYEFTPADQPDYYGYVKHGLAKSADTVKGVIDLLEKSRSNYSPDRSALRYYSASYFTEWDGREGELVALCLQNILHKNELSVDIIDFADEIASKE